MMSVSMLSDHRSTMPKKSIVAVTRIVERQSGERRRSIQAARATTPSQPISGTGRGNAGMAMSSWKNRTMALRASEMPPMHPADEPVVGALELHPVAGTR